MATPIRDASGSPAPDLFRSVRGGSPPAGIRRISDRSLAQVTQISADSSGTERRGGHKPMSLSGK